MVYAYDRTKRLRKNGTAAVSIRAYQGGSYSYFNTGVYIEPSHWCKRNNRVKNHPRERFLNTTILALQRKLESVESSTVELKGSCSLNDLKLYKDSKSSSLFVDFIKEEIKNERHKVGASTIETYEQTLAKFIGFRSDMTFKQLEHNGVKEFIDFLFAQGLKHNTVHKHYKILRKFIRLARKAGFLTEDKDPCDQVKVTAQRTTPLYLTEDELSLFERYDSSQDSELWQLAHKCFLFSCYTGLRWSDASVLTDDNIEKTKEGLVLHFISQKTSKPYRLNIRALFKSSERKESKPEQIVLSIMDAFDYLPGNKLFDFGHRNTYARILKQIATKLDLRKDLQKGISSHTARHTFGTIMIKKTKVEILQQLMQHSFVKETMVYVHLSNKRIYQALDKIEW